jgi:hypothetical protein
VEFIVECLNVDLEVDISTELTFTALAHWTLSFLPPDPEAEFAQGLPMCYQDKAPLQYRHTPCHHSCSGRHGHPNVDAFPPTENIVGISRDELKVRIVDIPSKCTRSKTAEGLRDYTIMINMPDSPIDQAPASNQDESGGSGRLLPVTRKRPNPVALFDYFSGFRSEHDNGKSQTRAAMILRVGGPRRYFLVALLAGSEGRQPLPVAASRGHFMTTRGQ